NGRKIQPEIRRPCAVRLRINAAIALRASESTIAPPAGVPIVAGAVHALPSNRIRTPSARRVACTPGRGGANLQPPAVQMAMALPSPAQAPVAAASTIQHCPTAGFAGGAASGPASTAA